MKTVFTYGLIILLACSIHFVFAQQDTIPVVFHVLHHGGAENISDAQILDAVRILNEDFNKRNADTAQVTPVFQSIIGNAQITFELATIDPQGNPTTGIERIYTSYITAPVADSFYVNQWNPSAYLNIWSVKNGPVQPPHPLSPASADSFPERDGIVMLNSYIGSVGSGSSVIGRALTHQVGHFLNLMHTWGDTNDPGIACGDDSVSDTPPTRGSTTCNLNLSYCNPPVVENVQNFMEYSYCSKMFTQGQVNRMKACLNDTVANRNNLRSLHVTGINNLVNNHLLLLMPNPCNSSFTIQLSSTPATQTYFHLFDALGQEVKREPVTGETTTVQRGSLPTGIYFWQLQATNKILDRGKVVME